MKWLKLRIFEIVEVEIYWIEIFVLVEIYWIEIFVIVEIFEIVKVEIFIFELNCN